MNPQSISSLLFTVEALAPKLDLDPDFDESPRLSSPSQADASILCFSCFLRYSSRFCFSTIAARSAIVMFAPFDWERDPPRRPLNASAPFVPVEVEVGYPGLGLAVVELEVDGVMGLELDADDAPEESRDNTSCVGFRAVAFALFTDPSVCGALGFDGADEFHKSAKESDMSLY